MVTLSNHSPNSSQMPAKTIIPAPKTRPISPPFTPTSHPNALLKRTKMKGNEREILKILIRTINPEVIP